MLKKFSIHAGYGDFLCTVIYTVWKKLTECQKYHPIEIKIIQCIDCGKDVKVDARNMTKIRCDECYKKYRAEKSREKSLKYYNKHKNN